MFITKDKRRLLVTSLAGIILTFTTIFGYQIEHDSKLTINVQVIALLLAFFAFTVASLQILYGLFDKAAIHPNKCLNISQGKLYIITLIALIIIYAFQFLALYPGLFIFDADRQYLMYVNGEISEHHPVLHTVLLGFIVDTVYKLTGAFNHGVAAYCIFQFIACALCISYFISFIFFKLKSICSLVFMLLFFGFYPPLVLQVMSATKDTFFFAFLLLVIVLTIEFVEDNEKFIHSPWKIFLWILSTVLIIIFRNNCIYAIPFFAIALLTNKRHKKKIIIGFFAITFFLYALYKIFFIPKYVTVEVNGREMYSVPAQQLMRIYHSNESDITSQERSNIEKLVNETGRLYYHPKISDMVKGSLDMTYYRENASEINKMYLSLLSRNIKLSLESFLENTCGFWYPGCELTINAYGDTGYWSINCFPPAVSNTKLNPVFDFYKLFESSDFVTKNPITSLFFSPGTFFYFFIIMFAYAIDRKKKAYIPSFFLIFALWLTYLLGPVALVRYVIFLYGMVPLYLGLVYEQDEQNEMNGFIRTHIGE